MYLENSAAETSRGKKKNKKQQKTKTKQTTTWAMQEKGTQMGSRTQKEAQQPTPWCVRLEKCEVL